ncbi:MAG: hypothetical protein ACSHXY_01765 [Alphaproteobacteria bacterium]
MVQALPAIDSPPIGDDRPVVLIATDDPVTSKHIGTHLSRCGFDVCMSVFDGKTLKNAPRRAPKAVLMCFKDHVHIAPHVLNSLKSRYIGHEMAIIGAFPDQGRIDISQYDSVIFPPAHPAQIAGRVNAMIRLSAMQREIALRIETLNEDFGIDYTLTEPDVKAPFRALFIGKASPQFMVVINALEKKNVEVIAAFTSYSAFDYLHETPFDAVVMNMLSSTEPGLTISETMRKNSALYHTPALMLTGADFSSHEIAYKKGATDIIPYGSEGEEISGRIIELANYHRLHLHLKTEFSAIGGERCIDGPSGTYNKAFFSAHLRRVRAADKAIYAPTSMLLLRIKPLSETSAPPERIKAAYDQVGRMVKNMVRMEDVAARLGDALYAVAFPAQAPERLQVVVDRLSGIIDSTVFKSGPGRGDTFTMKLDIELSAFQSGEDGQTLVQRVQKTLEKPTHIQEVS